MPRGFGSVASLLQGSRLLLPGSSHVEGSEERLRVWLRMQLFTWVLEIELGSSACCAPSAIQAEVATKSVFLTLYNRA